jgi:hypothetical protein
MSARKAMTAVGRRVGSGAGLGTVLVLVAAAAARAAGAPPPAAKGPLGCVTRGSDSHPNHVASPSPGVVSFCLDHFEKPTCWSVDLAAGRYTPLPVPRYDPDGGAEVLGGSGATLVVATKDTGVDAAAGGTLTVTRTPSDVKVCKSGGGGCRSYAPKGLLKDGPRLWARVNEAGTLMVIEIPGPAGALAAAETYDLATGKRIARFKATTPDAPCGSVDLVGDTVLLTTTVCEGPGESSWLVTPRGKKIAKVGAGVAFFSTAEMTPLHLSGDLWAFNAGNGGNEVVVQDVRTGKVKARMKLSAADTDAFSATALAGDGAGGIAVVVGGPRDGDVLLLDLGSGPASGPAAGSVKKRLSPPVCP